MRISVTIFVILVSTYIVNASVLDPVIENVVHLKASKPPSGVPGIWKKKTIWKPRWVKEWKSAKVMKPIWRKVWSPIQIREWVPIPKPPPGWDSVPAPLAPVRPKTQKVPFKTSLGHDSFESSTKMLLWDPIPYPDSQQPPPPPLPLSQAVYNSDVFCGKGGCDSTYSQSITHQQISEGIGPRYQTPEYYQNPQYSETVNHPINGNNWRPPQTQPSYSPDNGFRNFKELSEFLVPPKFQLLPESNFPLLYVNKHNPGTANTPISPSSERETQNSFRQWIPLPPENKINGHLVSKVPKQPHKFQTPDVELRIKNDENNSRKERFQNSNNVLDEKPIIQTQNTSTDPGPQADGDFIQEAQLVGEFHYSQFDLHNLKPEPKEPQLNLDGKEKILQKPQQKKEIIKQESGQNAEQNQNHLIDNVMENKGHPTRTEINNASVQSGIKQPEITDTQDRLNVEKKIIRNSNSNKSKFNFNFPQKEATIKEIFPVYKTPQNINPTTVKNQYLITTTPKKNQEKPLPLDQSSTKLTAIASNTSEAMFNVKEQMEIHPVFDIPKRVNPIFIPPNHRFFYPSEIKPQEKPSPLINSTRLVPLSAKPEKSIFDKNSSIQLVFAKTSDNYDHSKEDIQMITTTEPYEVIFSSSLLSTTEAATKSSLIIVTPVNSNKP